MFEELHRHLQDAFKESHPEASNSESIVTNTLKDIVRVEKFALFLGDPTDSISLRNYTKLCATVRST